MSVLQSITARLSKANPVRARSVDADVETDAGFATSEVRFSNLKEWQAACKKLGLKTDRQPSKMVIQHTAKDEHGNTVAVFNEDVELAGVGFGRISGRFFDNRGNVRV